MNGFLLIGQEHPYLQGKIVADSLDGTQINLINLTSGQGTISKEDGSFSIKARRGDTILFSSVQYKPHSVVVTDSLLEQKDVSVPLKKSVNLLSEVHINDKGLTGDLRKDLKKISFFDQAALGFPRLGPRRTTAERRLYSATTSLDAIINKLSGRLAMLERQLEYEKTEYIKEKTIAFMGKDFFVKKLGIPDRYIDAFLYYCTNFKEFADLVNSSHKMALIEFLLEKGKTYKEMWGFD